jgi:hypothetical protein
LGEDTREGRPEDEGSHHAEEENDVDCRSQKNCSGATSAMGEGKGCPEKVGVTRHLGSQCGNSPATRKGECGEIAIYGQGYAPRDVADLRNRRIRKTQRQVPRGLLIAILVSLIGPPVSAQVTDVFLSVEANLDRPVMKVSNAHPNAIEAFLITVDTAHNGRLLNRVYYDSHVTYRHDVPIAPGQSHELHFRMSSAARRRRLF